MTGYRFTPEAAADLFEIWSYIASDNAEAERTLKRPLQAEARSTSSSLGLPQAELGAGGIDDDRKVVCPL
jgi:plasmid stabilization system protein ParE